MVGGIHAGVAQDAFEQPERAAVDVVRAQDPLTGECQGGNCLSRSGAAGEGEAVACALERRDGCLEARACRIAGARVFPAAPWPADRLLGVSRCLVNRRRDRAGQFVGRHAGMDGQRLRSPGRVYVVGRVKFVALGGAVGRGLIGHRRARITGRWLAVVADGPLDGALILLFGQCA